MGKSSDRIFVGFTIALISFIGFSSQLFVILPSYPTLWNAEVLRLLLPFNALLALLFTSYFKCVVTDPGTVPKGWAPEKDENDGAVEVKQLTGGPRYCRSCREFKPPRAHHCRQCKKCILKMDHHCPWVNNCVGHNNHGHFIRFLFYVDVACSYHMWMISTRAFRAFSNSRDPPALLVVMLILNYTACVPVLIAVGGFSIFHFWSVGTNTTTIEGWEKDKVAVLKRRGKIREFKYPYNLGVLGNFKAVLGRNPLLWCWPQRMDGSGLKYPVAVGLAQRAQYSWPPEDEFSSRERESRRAERVARDSQPPFTYGDGLNPNLASSSSALRQRRPTKLQTSPYHPHFRLENPSSSSGDDGTPYPDRLGLVSDDDEIPLGLLSAQQGGNAGSQLPPAVRIRRGSEGLEIRPRVFRRPFEASWEHVADEDLSAAEGSEGEVDNDGDRIRTAPRYRLYEREPDSGSDLDSYSSDSGRSSGSTNSVDAFLHDM